MGAFATSLTSGEAGFNPDTFLAALVAGRIASRESILHLLRSLSEKGRTILLVTHSAEAAASRTILLRDGPVVN